MEYVKKLIHLIIQLIIVIKIQNIHIHLIQHNKNV